MKEFIPVLNLSSTTVHCALLQCFWIAFIISPVPPPECNSSPVHTLLGLSTWLSAEARLQAPLARLMLYSPISSLNQSEWISIHSSPVWEPSVIMSWKWGKTRWREMNAVHEDSGNPWREEKLLSCQLPSSFVLLDFGLASASLTGLQGEKSFDCLKLMPILAEAMGSLQHSHIFQF